MKPEGWKISVGYILVGCCSGQAVMGCLCRFQFDVDIRRSGYRSDQATDERRSWEQGFD